MTTEMTKNAPSVYCGTYAKYNNGSLKGAWINLAECGTYDRFMARCREVHRDEADPEFMYQDYECMPDGFGFSESGVSEDEFNDIMTAWRMENGLPVCKVIDYSEKAIAVTGDTKPFREEFKEAGGRFNARLTCGAGWIFSKKATDKVNAILGGVSVSSGKADTRTDADLVARWKKNLDEYAGGDDYYTKHNAGAVKIDGLFYLIPKPRIESQFCFADEGPASEVYDHIHESDDNMRAYFISENLDSGYDKEVIDLESKVTLADYDKDWNETGTHEDFKNPVKDLVCGRAWWTTLPVLAVRNKMTPEYFDNQRERERKGIVERPVTQAEYDELKAAIKWGRDCFKKRLDTYLKRYGTSKLHTWTYWADR